MDVSSAPIMSPRIAKSRAYIDEKRAKEQARAEAHDVATLQFRSKDAKGSNRVSGRNDGRRGAFMVFLHKKVTPR